MGMLASPLFTQKREASATPSKNYQPKLRRCNRTKESRAEIHEVCRSLVPREKGYSPAIEKFKIFLNYEQIKPPKESRQPLPKLSEAEYHTILVLEEQKVSNIVCSTIGKYIYTELKVGSADMALRESYRCILIAWNSTKQITHTIIAREKKFGSMRNWVIEKELFKKLVLELFRKWKIEKVLLYIR